MPDAYEEKPGTEKKKRTPSTKLLVDAGLSIVCLLLKAVRPFIGPRETGAK